MTHEVSPIGLTLYKKEPQASIEERFVAAYAEKTALSCTAQNLRSYCHEFYDKHPGVVFYPQAIVAAAIKNGYFVMARNLVPSFLLIMEQDLKTGLLNQESFDHIAHLLKLQETNARRKLI